MLFRRTWKTHPMLRQYWSFMSVYMGTKGGYKLSYKDLWVVCWTISSLLGSETEEDSALISLIVTHIIQESHVQIVQALIACLQSIQIEVSINRSIDEERRERRLWMRHVLSKSMRKHIVFISLVTKMLNPLHLVTTIVDETLVEEWEILPSLDHDIGFEWLLSEAWNGRVRHILGKSGPIGRKIVLDERNGRESTCVLV